MNCSNGSTGKVTRIIPLGAPARDVIVGSGGATFYVLDGTAKSASVTIVNSRNGDVQGTIPMPLNTVVHRPRRAGVSLYALQPDGQVSQVAVAGGTIMTNFTIGPGCALHRPQPRRLHPLRAAERGAETTTWPR